MCERLTAAVFPAANTVAGISCPIHALTYWVRKLRPTGPRATLPALVEVPACSLPLLRKSGSAFRLHLDQSRLLEIASYFDEVSLGRLLRVLERP